MGENTGDMQQMVRPKAQKIYGLVDAAWNDDVSARLGKPERRDI